MATHNGELVKSMLTGNVYCVTAWKPRKDPNQTYREPKTRYDVTDSFQQLARQEFDPLYHMTRELLRADILSADERCRPDEEIRKHNEKIRQELIFFGHPKYTDDLQADDWLERVRGWVF